MKRTSEPAQSGIFDPSDIQKQCGLCRQTKPLSAFAKGGAAHGRQSQCKECQNSARRELYHSDPNWQALQRARTTRVMARKKYGRETLYGNHEFAHKLLSAKSCHYCKIPNDGAEPFCLDHYQPLVLGGENSLENLVPCCERCNRAKHDSPPEDFLRWLNRGGLA